MCSLESGLAFEYICSVWILDIFEVIVKNAQPVSLVEWLQQHNLTLLDSEFTGGFGIEKTELVVVDLISGADENGGVFLEGDYDDVIIGFW